MAARPHPGIQQAALMPNTHSVGGTIAPTLRYRDVRAAIDWLCKAFGFERRRVLTAANGAIHYAELRFGDGTIMLGPVQESDTLMAQPEDVGGVETQICYLFVEDACAHYARAKTGGAEIVLDIEAERGTGRGYACRDLEGHIWNFGTYDPRHGQPLKRRGTKPQAMPRPRVRSVVSSVGLLVNAITAILLMGLAYLASEHASSSAHASASSHRAAMAHEAVSRTAKDADEPLSSERKARTAAEREALEAREQFAQERIAREAAERVAKNAKDQLASELGNRADLELTIAGLRKTIASHEAISAQSPPPSATREAGIQIERIPNKYINLDGYTKHSGKSYPECERLCLAEAKCLGIEFNRKNRTCELFDRLDPFVADVDADVGVKQPH
jgi:uncharacterized glyoxalase superfamily protein PhnB